MENTNLKSQINYESNIMLRAESFEEMGLKKKLVQGI